jgi:PAS domain S-box-containing protein
MIDAMPNQAEEMLRSIRLSPLAMVVTDPSLPDNPIVAANPAFERLTQYHEEEIVGRNCRFLAGPATDNQASARLGTAVARRRPALVELLNYRRDGSTFCNAVMLAPWYDEDGALRFFVGSQMESGGTAAIATRQRAAGRLVALTQRQLGVLRLMAAGLRNKQIATRLTISEKTVKMHRARLLARLGVATSTEAIRIAVEAGI